MYFQACCCHFLLFYILSNFIMPLSLSKKSSGQEIPEKRRCIFSKDSCINSSVWYAIKMSYINAFLQHLLTQKRIHLVTQSYNIHFATQQVFQLLLNTSQSKKAMELPFYINIDIACSSMFIASYRTKYSHTQNSIFRCILFCCI